jgi:hypothetical protein
LGAALGLIAALALAACYTSNALLLDPDAAVHPLADGVYERADASHERYRISLTPDGWYDVEDFNPNGTIGLTHKVVFNRLEDQDGAEAPHSFAVAEETENGFVYAAVLVRGERVYLATPDCADSLDAGLAVDHGGQREDDDAMSHDCVFRTKEAVMAALTDFVGQADFGAPYLRK